MNQRIGVYICHCGSNISDVVDVIKVRESVKDLPGVAIAKNVMFACADSSQKEIVEDIRNYNLDGLVIASCSPKLHLFTFRAVAERAGLNYNHYVQVNIREQSSWAHGDKPREATEKAIQLIKSGIAKAKLAESLTPMEVSAKDSVLVVGAGVAGMRAAIELADMGMHVYLIEKETRTGGHVALWKSVFPTDESGTEIAGRLYKEVKKRNKIQLFTGAGIIHRTGSIGNFEITINIRKLLKDNGQDKQGMGAGSSGHEENEERLILSCGAILLCTGFEDYRPAKGVFGFGESENIITLPEFKKLVEQGEDKLVHAGREVKNIAYIYCVGSRQEDGENKFCSRYCCSSAAHTALEARKKFPRINNFHINRGIRTYGKHEILYQQSSAAGDTFLQFNEDHPVEVTTGSDGKVLITLNDILTAGRELELEADLVVLVTGITPSGNSSLTEILKVPAGRDGFYNEVHPKLRPVETVMDGIYIAGCCQGPKTITESIRSSLSASSKIYSLLGKQKLSLEPTQAKINTQLCEWCDNCRQACPFDAVRKEDLDGKSVAFINASVCKGCGMCLPVCEPNAINLVGYSDVEVESMIEALAE